MSIKSIFTEQDAENLFYYGRNGADEKLEQVIGMMDDKNIESSVFQTIGVVFAREYRRYRAEFGEPTSLSDMQLASSFNTAVKLADYDYMEGGMYAPCLRDAFGYMCADEEERIAA